MFKRVYKTIIGKDLTRSATPVLYPTSAAAQSVQTGEIFILDQNRVLMTPGMTYQDTPVIYIAVVTADTVTYVDKATAPHSLTAQRLIVSDPIDGRRVSSYTGRAFVSTVSTVISFVLTAPTVGREYVLRIFYKDIPEHPGQFTQTFRYVATTTDQDDLGNALVAKINGYVATRCTASYSTTTDTLTLAFNLPKSSTSTVNDIDEFQLPYGDAFFDYVDTTSASYGQAAWVTTGFAKTVTPGIIGNGNWYQVRDAEKLALPNRGIINRTLFPVIQPDFLTVKSTNYNQITIEHDKVVRTAALQEQKMTILTTQIFLPVNTNQTVNILGVLNPWMNSTPSMLEPITAF